MAKLAKFAFLAFLVLGLLTRDIYGKEEEPEEEEEEDEEEDEYDGKLKIEEVHEIEGCKPKSREGDRIHWRYKGTFLDGKEFDSGTFSATLGQGHVIVGVDKGMRGLCVGEKRRMTIHSDWAYGDQGYADLIPGGSTLVFDVEMLSVERPEGAEDDEEEEEEEEEEDEEDEYDGKLKLEELHTIEGCSPKSQEGDTIHWKYKGTFLDGKEFDSGTFSATLGHGHVIEGVDIGMRGLCVGEKRRMTMHSDLGYGDHGTGGIPGGASLVFEVEMTNIERPHQEL